MPTPEAWTCPRCGSDFAGTPDADGMVSCPEGHRAYSGYVAEASHLRPRLQWLDDRISAGDLAPDPEAARLGGVWPVTHGRGQPAPTSSDGLPSRPGPTQPRPQAADGHGLQVLLLGLGAGLLIVAGIVFTAVVWDHLGALGHVGVMAVATLGFGAAAVRLAHRLPGTAEALAMVAFGLAVVDVVAAPALGLVPESWLDVGQPYFAAVTCLGAVALVGLGHRFALRAWVWSGWASLAVGGMLATWWLALGPADSTNPAAAFAVTVVALVSVGLAAGPYVSARLAPDTHPMTAAGLLAAVLALPPWATWLTDLDRAALVGTAGSTLVTAVAAAWVWRRTGQPLAGVAAAVLAGVGGGLALLLLPGDDALWLAAVAAAVGLAVLVALARAGRLRAGLVASAALWGTWALGRLAIDSPALPDAEVFVQVALLLGLVALTWFGVAWWCSEPLMAWAAAAVGEVGWLAALPSISEHPVGPEAWALPLSVLLLAAGALWHRSRPGESALWLGPGVTVALLPSALACWGAPWVVEGADQSTREAAVRLVLVLVASVAAVAAGARWRLAGLLLPGVAALALVGAAQVWTGLGALPRWLGIALAGGVVFVLGARIEWLRTNGRKTRTYVAALR